MNVFKKLFLTFGLLGCSISPLFSASCGNKQQYSVSDLINLYTQPVPEKKGVWKSDLGASLAARFNKFLTAVKSTCFSANLDNLVNEMLYDTFHFINLPSYTLNNFQFTSENETLIQLYEKNVVDFSFVYSSLTDVKPLTKDGFNSYSIVFSSMLQVSFRQSHKISDIHTVPAGTTITYIGEFQEENFLSVNKDNQTESKMLPENPSEYYKYGTASNQYKWRPNFPSFQNSDKIFGIIKTSIAPMTVFPITLDYMTESTWTNYVWTDEVPPK